LVLNGRKYYSTGALLADWVSVFALNEQDQIVTVIIERGAPGLEIVDDWSSIGQRTTASGTTIFNDVQVRSEQVIEHWHTYDRPNVFGALLQIMHVAIDVGIADAAIEDTVSFIRERSRPWFQSGVERASDDPHTIKRLGELIVQRDAAHAMLQRAASVLQKVRAAPVTAETATEASLAVAGAKAVATEAAIAITNELFALCGTSSADVEHNLDRHWRNARVHTLHDPVRWKYHHIGNFALNGEVPASSGWL
jgi:alkylation response protein AidB-like acyl-CoA dehydrogenase